MLQILRFIRNAPSGRAAAEGEETASFLGSADLERDAR